MKTEQNIQTMLRRLAYHSHKGVKIGYISDVHTEFRKAHNSILHLGPSVCDVLVLAGDIGNPFKLDNSYKYFLENCTNYAKHTIVIAGNHEFYQGNRFSMGQTKMKINNICDAINTTNKSKTIDIARKTHNNITFAAINANVDEIDIRENNIQQPIKGDIRFLDDEVFTYNIPFSQDIIRFIGSTLWSDIDPKHETEIYRYINDYNQIMEFTPKKSRALYQKSTEFINTELLLSDKTENTTNIVVTHYPPTTQGVIDPRFEGSNLNSAFCSDFVFDKNITEEGGMRPHAWIFGHTHYNVNRLDTKLGTLLLSNQVGYPSENITK